MRSPAVSGRLAGTRTIVRFNWPKFLLVPALATGAAIAASADAHVVVVGALVLAAGLGTVWSVTSLAATWWVYDRTDLYARIGDGLAPVGPWLVVHAGFDESTAPLTAAIGHGPVAVVALTTPARRGLRQARRVHRAVAGPASVSASDLHGSPDASVDTAFVSLAVHEVRSVADQRELFAELRRVLVPGGRLVITEHLLGVATAAVYGPAAWHFRTGRTWLDRAAEQGLSLDSDDPITPFVHRFVWRRPDLPVQVSAAASASSSA